MKPIAESILSKLNEFDLDSGDYIGDYTDPYEDSDDDDYDELDSDDVEENQDELSSAFNDLLDSYGFDDIRAQVEDDGDNYIVTFIDDDGDTETVVFGTDEDGAFAMVDSQNEDDSDDSIVVDLDLLEPTYDEDGRLDLSDPSWITKETLVSLLAPLATNELDVDQDEGYFLRELKNQPLEEGILSNIRELIARAKQEGKRFTGKFKTAIRGGQITRIPVFQRIKKAVLSPKQKAALKKMLAKAHSARAIAKRVMSFKRGERFHAHPQHDESFAFDEVKSGPIKNHKWIGRQAKFIHPDSKQEVTGTVTGVWREPTFSQMVPWKTEVGIEHDGKTHYIRKERVKMLKESFDESSLFESDEKCPKCGSDNVKEEDGQFECDDCGYTWTPEKDEEEDTKDSNESFDESKNSSRKQLEREGWSYDDESKSFKHPNFPGHEFVNWGNGIHHLIDNEHVKSVPQWSRQYPKEDLPKYLRGLRKGH